MAQTERFKPEPILVSMEEGAAMLGCHRATIYQKVDKGLIEAVKDGRRTLLPVASLKAYAASLPRMQPKQPS